MKLWKFKSKARQYEYFSFFKTQVETLGANSFFFCQEHYINAVDIFPQAPEMK